MTKSVLGYVGGLSKWNDIHPIAVLLNSELNVGMIDVGWIVGHMAAEAFM